MPSLYARPELLASADWLAENVARPGIRVVDCRYRVDGTGRSLYATAHIPGAAFLDWAVDLVEPHEGARFQLAGPERFAAAISRAGIGDGTTAVLYDDAASLYASRVWWSLRAYSFTAVRVLNGGWEAWQQSGRPSSSAATAADVAPFTPRANPDARLSAADVRALLGSDDVCVMDARSPAEFRGHEGIGERRGHVPGAINVPAALLTRAADRTFLPAPDLRSILERAGFAGQRRVVTYDSSGISAAKLAFAVSLVGHADVAVYDGGWAEWASRPELPVEA